MTQPPAPTATATPYKPPDQETAYSNAQAAVDALKGKGWRVVAMRPAYQTTPNEGAVGSEPPTSSKQIGATVDLLGPNGEPDSIIIGPSDKSVTWDLTPDPATGQLKPLQPGVVVLKGPTTAPPAGSQPGSPITEWVRIDANGKEIAAGDTTTPAVYIRDPKAPATTQPFKLEEDQKLGDPKTWQPITNPNDPAHAVIGLYDPKTSKLAASVPAKPNAQPNGDLQPFIDPNDPAHKRVIAVIDQGDFSIHPVAQVDGKQIVTTPSAIYVIDKDSNKSVKVQDIDKSAPFQAVVTDGVRYIFDPNEKDPTKAYKRDPNQSKLQPTMKGSDGTDWVLVEDPNDPSGLGGHYIRPPGVTKPATVDAPGSAALEYIIYRDENGKEISRSKNPNWTGFPQPTAPPTDTVSRTVPRWNKDKGVWEDVENKQRIVASDALRAMAQQLTGQVIAGDISEDEATKLITAANAKMANDIAQQKSVLDAAGTALTTSAQGAQTGAGLLNQRVQAGASMLGNVLSFAGGSHLRGLPEGTGQALMGDIQGFATNLGGGQDVYDTAVRMVHAADPSAPNELTAKATAFITQVLNKQTEQNGGVPPPAVQVTQQLKQNLQSGQGGMAAPVTVQSAGMAQPTAVAQGFVAPPMQLPGQNYGAGIGYTGGVAPSSYGFTPPGGSSYSYGGPVPWAGATPQPLPQGFVVPVTTPVPPAVTVPMPGRLT